MTVQTPFRFAPINRWIYEPKWGEFVSHDVPFKDGLCGSIDVDIEATSPLLIGGARRNATDNMPAEVWPFRLADGRYGIPSSSLQGMTRSILEIAGFGRLGDWVDEKRFGVRDLTDTAKPFYRNRLIGKVRAGFLYQDNDGWKIQACELRRIKFAKIPTGGAGYDWSARSSVQERYSRVAGVGPYQATGLDFDTNLARNEQGTAWVVVTGNTGVRRNGKSKEFVFVSSAKHPPIVLHDSIVRDFRFIHEAGSSGDPRDWNEAWRFFKEEGYPAPGNKNFDEGGRVPVFYLPDGNGGIESFGLAFMFKLAHSKSTHDLLANSSDRHLVAERPDLASLIFGMSANGDSNQNPSGLKRRASFDFAPFPQGTDFNPPNEPVVLLSPKPSYHPVYVRQWNGAVEKGNDSELPTIRGQKVPFATFTPLSEELVERRTALLNSENQVPELSGTKIWPSMPSDLCQFPDRLPQLNRAIASKKRVQVYLNTLPRGSSAKTGLRFHNLRPMEVGALLWALTFADKAAMNGNLGGVVLRHRIGMGKPYGLGSIRVAVSNLRIVSNDPNHPGPSPTVEMLVKAFTDHMTAVYGRARGAGKGKTWEESIQIRALLKAANPALNTNVLPRYMVLGTPGQPDSYVGERALGHFLPSYADGDEFPKTSTLNKSIGAGSASVRSPARRRVRDRGGEEGFFLKENSRGEVLVQFDYGEKEWVRKTDLTYI